MYYIKLSLSENNSKIRADKNSGKKRLLKFYITNKLLWLTGLYVHIKKRASSDKLIVDIDVQT